MLGGSGQRTSSSGRGTWYRARAPGQRQPSTKPSYHQHDGGPGDRNKHMHNKMIKILRRKWAILSLVITLCSYTTKRFIIIHKQSVKSTHVHTQNTHTLYSPLTLEGVVGVVGIPSWRPTLAMSSCLSLSEEREAWIVSCLWSTSTGHGHWSEC